MDKLQGLKMITQFQLRDNLDKVPYHWKLEDWEIEEKIKELQKEIYILKNSRKYQPKLLTFENDLHGSPISRVFEGWCVRFEDVKDKNPLMIADYHRLATERDLKNLTDLYISEKAIKLIKSQSK